jgi:transitional endoplasmic reticulum ATPase
MGQYEHKAPEGVVARVRAVTREGRRVFLELPNGRIATVDASGPLTLSLGTVVLVREADNHLEEAPRDLWPQDTWVGVVRLTLPDVTVVYASGQWKMIKTNPEVGCREGNTVEADDIRGVIRVLAEDPIKYIDLPAIDESDISRFEQKSAAGQDTYDDFGGLRAVVDRARELIEVPLTYGDHLSRIGARPIKGVLFTGPPGTGKTMLARTIANKAGCAFYEISGPEILSKWYGQSEEILRMLFERASRQKRAIIFFDEIDSIAGQRADESHEASRRVVAQLLTLMDGFDSADRVIVIAATNRPQDIDAALRRPGRFDWEIHFPLPDLPDRELILRTAQRRLSTRGEFPFRMIAEETDTWSGAELSAIWREAAFLAAKDDRSAIIAEDFAGGYERVRAQRQHIAQDAARGGSR